MSGPSYQIIAKKGRGGMAEVFKAIKSGPDGFSKTVALKRILPYYSDQAEFINMLSTEARINSYLNHPNIVQILDFFEENKQYTMVLEYVDGKNLRQILDLFRQKNQIFPWQATLFIIMEVLKGLSYAHVQRGADGPLNIIHRDVSPQNILLSYQGEVKLTDFGIARAQISDDKDDTSVKGKYRYVSPEQVLQVALTPASDIFSAGVILYEMLSSLHPFGQQQEYQTMRRILEQPHVPLNALVLDIPPELSQIVDKVLQKKPADRYPTVRDFYEELLDIQDSSWITHGQELLATLLNSSIAPEDRVDEAIESTSRLADSITRTSSLLLPVTKPDSQLSNRPKAILYGILIAVIGLGVWYFTKPQKFSKVSTPVIANIAERGQTPVPETSTVPQKNSTSVPQTSKTAPPQSKSSAKSGQVVFKGPEGTQVYVNGKYMASLPSSSITLPFGKYMVLFHHDRLGRQVRTLTVSSKATQTISWR